jgi:ADP-glucose pyrophosphorylase
MIADVIIHQNGNWEIHQYNTYNKQIRTIKAYYADKSDQKISKSKDKIPSRYEITANGILGYSLKLELIEVQQNPS